MIESCLLKKTYLSERDEQAYTTRILKTVKKHIYYDKNIFEYSEVYRTTHNTISSNETIEHSELTKYRYFIFCC